MPPRALKLCWLHLEGRDRLALRIASDTRVRTCDGSRTEWGNDPVLPIQHGVGAAAA